MGERTSASVALQIQGSDQVILAQPEPKDEGRLRDLLGAGAKSVVLNHSYDTEGHAAADTIVLDVEGHAVALRLPNTADAAAVRRAFAMGVVTASLVIGGAAAAAAGADALASAQQAQAPAPAADAEQPAGGGSPLHLPRPIDRE